MIQNYDLKIFTENKKSMQSTKDLTKETYSSQIMNILDHYRSVPVEKFADIIINIHEENIKLKKSTITIKQEHLIHEDYYRKVYRAILTKLPRLEFKEMLLYMFYDYFNS
ncbi:spindle assembly checkpoint component MAD1 [Gottfriedia solisilvae]|uniref:spindle assembly checkpoint component MAD1 n=1 Tax=Gottfriedia solisilvae TaxID=1516104 RepID=UPI003D2F02C1